jgi:predicted peroxiredoxin
MSSGIGTGLAEGAQKKGAKITVIIGANSIKYVTKENSDPLKFPAKNKTIKKVLEGMIAKGADVMVCKMCAVAAGLTQDDFIYGANITKSGPIIDAIMADNTKALIY